jgi:hypothetical protein
MPLQIEREANAKNFPAKIKLRTLKLKIPGSKRASIKYSQIFPMITIRN